MATSGSYYLNGPSLTSSTAVFTDSGLTTLAPDGFYSDGTIVRQQVGGILLPAAICESCEPVCLEYTAISEGDSGIVEYIDCFDVPQTITVVFGEPQTFCALSNTLVPSEGVVIIENGNCVSECTSYVAIGTEGGGGGTVEYTDCDGIVQIDAVPDGGTIYFCSSDAPGEIITTGAVEISLAFETCP